MSSPTNAGYVTPPESLPAVESVSPTMESLRVSELQPIMESSTSGDAGLPATPDSTAMTASTPVLSAQDGQFDDDMDLDSVSDLTSLQTTPTSSPASQKSNVQETRKTYSAVLVPHGQSLTLKLWFSTPASLQKILSSVPTPSASTPVRRSARLGKLTATHAGVEDPESLLPVSALQKTAVKAPKPVRARGKSAIADPIEATKKVLVRGQTASDDPVKAPESVLATRELAVPKTRVKKGKLAATIKSASLSSSDSVSKDVNSTQAGDTSSEAAPSQTKGRNKRLSHDADFVDAEGTDAEREGTGELSLPTKKRKRQNKAAVAKPAVADAAPDSEVQVKASKAKTTKASTKDEKYHKNVQEKYDLPYGEPPAWASTRQALCETLPYYRAFQSGAYTHGGIVRGLLIDQEGSPRDIFDEEVVITRVGGGRTKVDGKMVQTVDKDLSPTHRAFMRNEAENLPVAIIAGQGNKFSPSKMPHFYNVLAWYHVTNVWSEKVDGVKVPMVRLEKIDILEKSWWSKVGTPLPDQNRELDVDQTTSASCPDCRDPSQQIFSQGWTCLNTACARHFTFSIPAGIADEAFLSGLTYDGSFVDKRTKFQGKITEPLAPALPSNNQVGAGLSGYEEECCKGVVCPKCSACSRRRQWEQWSCENCAWSYTATQSITSVAEAMGVPKLKNIEMCDDSIRSRHILLGKYHVDEYKIPGEETQDGSERIPAGIVRHFRSNDIINSQINGPNELFRQVQQGGFGLERYPCMGKNSPGEMLTNHFLMNWGAEYKFVAPVDSKGFGQASPIILSALMRMTWAGKEIPSDNKEPFVPFNQLLQLGYFEGGAMGYHDDGESTLGPTVGSFSLGASATMSFRPKKKVAIGPASTNQRGNKPPMLRIVLNHGDLLIMHGAAIQKFYEHEIVPHGKVRFVFTCRHIVPEKIPDVEVRAKSRIDGALPGDIDQYAYNGDVGAVLVPPPADDEEKAQLDNLEARIISGTLSKEAMERLIQIVKNAA